jgi:hypothetical protein
MAKLGMSAAKLVIVMAKLEMGDAKLIVRQS